MKTYHYSSLKTPVGYEQASQYAHIFFLLQLTNPLQYTTQTEKADLDFHHLHIRLFSPDTMHDPQQLEQWPPTSTCYQTSILLQLVMMLSSPEGTMPCDELSLSPSLCIDLVCVPATRQCVEEEKVLTTATPISSKNLWLLDSWNYRCYF